MTTEARRKANARYDKANTKFVGLKLNRNTDRDIVEYLERQENVQGTIKSLIRLGMQFEKPEK